ncbi:MAG: HAD family hydrolase [Chitinophagaceae bacterium]
MMKIDAIILDLGGVLLNLDYRKTEDAFIKLGIPHFSHLYNQHQADFLFTDFETGKISPEDFIQALINESSKKITTKQVIEAWNAMLLDFPPERIALLKKLKTHFPLFLFSNTNGIHLPAFNQKLTEEYGLPSLDELFNKAYYSHLIGERKPDLAAYRIVIRENNLNPATTLFVDDNAANVKGAEKAGLFAVQLKESQPINELIGKILAGYKWLRGC